jgi:hypothetical protein
MVNLEQLLLSFFCVDTLYIISNFYFVISLSANSLPLFPRMPIIPYFLVLFVDAPNRYPECVPKPVKLVPGTRNSYRYPQSAIRSDPHHFNGYGLTYHPIRQGADRPTIRPIFATNPTTIRRTSDPQSASNPMRNPIRNPQVIRSGI